MDLKASQVNNYKIAIAFDFGLKRIGLAVGQTLTKTAQPVHILKLMMVSQIGILYLNISINGHPMYW